MKQTNVKNRNKKAAINIAVIATFLAIIGGVTYGIIASRNAKTVATLSSVVSKESIASNGVTGNASGLEGTANANTGTTEEKTSVTKLGGFSVTERVNAAKAAGETISNKEMQEYRVQKKYEKASSPIYISDTKPVENTEGITSDVYKYMFDRTGIYVPNKDFAETYGEERTKQILELAKTFMNDAYSANYHTIEANKEAYINKASENVYYVPYVAHNGDWLYPDQLFEEQADWMIKHKIQADVKFKTNDSLIWQDGLYTCVRGELEITPYSSEGLEGDEVMCPSMTQDLDFKNGGKYTVEIAVAYFNEVGVKSYGMKELMIQNFSVLGKVEE